MLQCKLPVVAIESCLVFLHCLGCYSFLLHRLWFLLLFVFYLFVCCCQELNSGPVYTMYMLCKLSHVPNTRGFSPGYSFLNLNFNNGCISYSSHCCDRIPNKSMLRKEGFVLTGGEYSSQQQQNETAGYYCVMVRKH